MLQYCGRCHVTVEPGMLDKKSWTDYVLPAMATKMGIKVWGKNQYYAAVDKQESDISFNDWLKLVAYYKDHSYDTLKSARVGVPLLKDWFVFDLKKPVVQTTGKASTLMVAFDTINKLENEHRDAQPRTIRRLAEALGVEPTELMKG